MLWHLISKTIMISGLNVIQGIDLLVAFSCCQQWTGTELMWGWDDPATVCYSMRFACFLLREEIFWLKPSALNIHIGTHALTLRDTTLQVTIYTHEVYVYTPALQHCAHGNDARKFRNIVCMTPSSFCLFCFSIALVAAQQGNISCSLRLFPRFDLQ